MVGGAATGLKGAALAPSCPATVVVNTGTGAAEVSVGKGVKEAATGGGSVLNCESRDVLVTDGIRSGVDVWFGRAGCASDVEVMVITAGVPVRGWRRYAPVSAIDVLVPLALCTAVSVAVPSVALQKRTIRIMNRPVIPSACK